MIDSKRPSPALFSAMLLLAVSMTCGCKSKPPLVEPPETVPVTGKVIDRNGQPLVQGMVEFRAVEGKPWTTMGITADDGTFTLKTMVNGQQLEGAVVGEHRVTVTPPFSDSPEQSADAGYQSRRPVKVKAEGENNVTIDMRK
jgi:hypothetical protein